MVSSGMAGISCSWCGLAYHSSPACQEALRWVTVTMMTVMCHVSCVTCHVSRVMCHVSCVMCHVSCVMCHVSRVTCSDRPGDLVVHLGDWDLRYDYSNKYEAGEEFPHIEVRHSEL